MTFGEGTDNSDNRYKYNGKELNRMHGLDLYDYVARMQDGMRFTTIDPLAEKYYSVSPYVYCGNNPINRIDPTGMDWYKNEDGTAIMWRDSNDDTYTETLNGDEGSITIEYYNIGGNYAQSISDGSTIFWNQNEAVAIKEPSYFSQRELSFFEKWGNYDNFFVKIAYETVNDWYVTLQGLDFGLLGKHKTNDLTGGKAFANLDGSSNYEGINSCISVMISFISPDKSLPKGLGYCNKLNAAQFSHLCKGTFVNKLSPGVRGFLNTSLNNKIIDYWNGMISNGGILLNMSFFAPNDKK